MGDGRWEMGDPAERVIGRSGANRGQRTADFSPLRGSNEEGLRTKRALLFPQPFAVWPRQRSEVRGQGRGARGGGRASHGGSAGRRKKPALGGGLKSRRTEPWARS